MIFLLFILLITAAFFFKPYLQKGLEWFIVKFTGISKGFGGKIFPVFIKVLTTNWYTYLILILIWRLLFFTEVGKDTIDAYLSNLKEFDPLFSFLSYLSLFACVCAMSLVIWVLPFFMFSQKRIEEIKARQDDFYLSTKVLAFVAMLPFILIGNAFFSFSQSTEIKIWVIIVFNCLFFILFLLLVILFKLRLRYFKISALLKPYIKDIYVFILVRIALSLIFLTIVFVALKYMVPDTKNTLNPLSYLVAIYLFVSSAIVFRLLFYSSESTKEDISRTVTQMLSEENKRNSRRLYFSLIWILIGAVLYYYFVPSLEATNPLYILLIVFSFYIIYLDYWRNIFNNKQGFLKVLATGASALFLVLPFISRKDQYTVPLINKRSTEIVSLGEALQRRYNYILKNNPDTGNIFIVCAMGGGSRAGYFTADVLKAIDNMHLPLWDQTICYSTVSGGSVGTYNYIKGRMTHRIEKDTGYLRFIYEKNYNSSGVYGLLIGDALETLFAPALTKAKGWISNDSSATGFYDRNHRIRREYDYVLQDALSSNTRKSNYFHITFYPWSKHDALRPDTFQNFFLSHRGEVPVHLINTFEVNSGRRTVLSPFPAPSNNFFSNSIVPLQDSTFDKKENILTKDILYRDAVNLSELFPLISAASNIGTDKEAQFVDGGYYENYGLTTAMEVLYFLRDSLCINPKRLKVLLIKNSRQNPVDSGHQVQLFAPLNGVMVAPFTGHANNLLAEAFRALDNAHVDTIVFDAKKKKVPLTRSLTQRHIDSMDTYIKFISTDAAYRQRLERFIEH